MTRTEKIEACTEFYNKLCDALSDTHENVASCNKDISAYLIPVGTMPYLSYRSKPPKSFRISDHWNWYANLNKCDDEHYVQCYSVDAPRPKQRVEPGKPSKPIYAIQICYFGDDSRYHGIFGEKYDRKKKVWTWKDNTIENAISALAG